MKDRRSRARDLGKIERLTTRWDAGTTRGRRKILQRTKSLLRHLGLGHMRNMGADLPYRRRVEFMLVTIFGETFDKESYWYGRPNPDMFFAALMNMAGARERVTPVDGSQIFKLKQGTTSYEVNRPKLKALGVQERTLREMFARTPAADERYQVQPVACLVVPSPDVTDALDYEPYPEEVDEEEVEEDAANLDDMASMVLTSLSGGVAAYVKEESMAENGSISAKKRASGKRPAKRLRTETAGKENASLDKSAEAKLQRNKGKELLEDNEDEMDDAEPAEALEDDGGDVHTAAMQDNMRRCMRLVPRDKSYAPQPIANFDFGWDPEMEEKQITDEFLSEHYELDFVQAESTNGLACAGEEIPWDPEMANFVIRAFAPVNHDRAMELVAFDASIAQLRGDLVGWLGDSAHAGAALEQLEKLRQIATVGIEARTR